MIFHFHFHSDQRAIAEQTTHANTAVIQNPNEIVVPKNSEQNVHCQNASYRTRCMICKHIDPSLINHYRIAHPDSDVFISRPSPRMVERMLSNSECSIFKDGKISGFCFFCEKTKTMTEMEWRSHLLSHTGELEFYCSECHSQWGGRIQHGTRLIDNTTSVFDQIAKTDSNTTMMLFMCKRCNYVQVHKPHIIRHVVAIRNVQKRKVSANLMI